MKTLAIFLPLILAACGGGGGGGAPAPADVVYHVAAYGDSTQEAQGNPHAASTERYRISNHGISGTNTTDLLAADWSREMAAQPAPVVVVNHGMNDRGIPIEQYGANLAEIVTVARAARKAIILEEPNAAGETETPLMAAVSFDVAAHEARRAEIRRVAQALGVYFCAQPRVPLSDGIHPTAEGYATKARRLRECLTDLLG